MFKAGRPADRSRRTDRSKQAICAYSTESGLHRFIERALILTLLIVQCWLPVAQAQVVGETSAGIDIDPPVINLEETPTGIAGESQVFTAQVSDNLALKDVKLYYRYSGQGPFTSLIMLPLSNTDFFTAKIPTSSAETRSIEYYIQARDQSGNRVVTGYAFDPLVRTLNKEQPKEPSVVAAPTESSSENSQPSRGGGVKWWHIALGVLAVGAIAGMAGGDSGGGNSNPSTGTGVAITLTATPPN